VWCLSCEQFCRPQLCQRCAWGLEVAPDTATPEGLVVRAAFVHEGTARQLVTKLKYQGVDRIAGFFAEALLERVPSLAQSLVPIPRVFVRRVKYGVDPTFSIAKALARLTGLPIVGALNAPLWAPRSAGRALDHRQNKQFWPRNPAQHWLLVDDVVTSGSTLWATAGALSGTGYGAVTATASL
jgi:predicted amidophosphoribosyltransferase